MKSDGIGRSALRKLIPAVAMLAASAVMLSTATYAWFTMNKEVQLTGLNMSATAADGIEISLASVTGDDNKITFSDDTGTYFKDGHPLDTEAEKGWKSTVAVANYYSDIGKLKPASSVDGKTLFYATDASGNGKIANNFKAITLGADTMAQLTGQSTFSASNTVVGSTGNAGYYVDIPVHIRTSKTKTESETEGNIYYKMIINNNKPDGAAENYDEINILYKAVRIAFIDSNNNVTGIYACDDGYYNPGQAVKSESGESTRGPVTVKTASVTSDTTIPDGVGTNSGLIIPYADGAGNYGHLDFTIRVWLEGESTSCYDATAGQEWNISFAFCLGEFDTPAGGGTNGG